MNDKYEKFKEHVDGSLNSVSNHHDKKRANTAFAIAVINDRKINIRRYAAMYKFEDQHDAAYALIKSNLNTANIHEYDEVDIKKALFKIGILSNRHLFTLGFSLCAIICFLYVNYSKSFLTGIVSQDNIELLNISSVMIFAPMFILLIRLSLSRFRFYRI